MDIKILIVDDSKVSQEIILHYINKLGYTADLAADAKSAIQLIEQTDYEIIITDKNMPGTDSTTDEGGMQLLKYVRENVPDVPVVMMTGNASVETAIEAMKLGAFDYLVKPISYEVMQDILTRMMQYRDFINPENTIDLYMELHNEILNIVEKSNLANEESHQMIRSLDSKMDNFFKVLKKWEKIIIEQRDVIANISFNAEQLMDEVSQNKLPKELVEKIYQQSCQRI